MNRLINKVKKYFYNQRQYQNYLKRSGLKIGDGCEINKDVCFGSEPYLIEIGNYVRITSGCKFITHDGGVWVLRHKTNNINLDLIKKIKIGNNIHIGINSIIMPGVTIGDNVIIGCGAVVTKNIPSGEIWGGVPAKKITSIDEYFEKHKSEFKSTKNMNKKEKKKYLEKNCI